MAETVKIVCSTIPGFESVALNECKEKLNLDAKRDVRGRVAFNIEIEKVQDLAELRSVHHYWVVVADLEDFFKADQSKEEIFAELTKLPAEIDWTKALETWKRFRLFKQNNGGLDPVSRKRKQPDGESKNDLNIDYNTITPLTERENLRFRATATRTGTHVFSSMESACHLGGGVNDHFHWKVDLKNFDLEVVVYIVDNFISVGIQLTKESQSLRNITHFGPTTLKPNISYCLLKSSQAKPGDVICDPMCGGGSIPLEGAHSLPGVFNLGGDNHSLAVSNAGENIQSYSSKKTKEGGTPYTINMSAVQWDVYCLPLRDACVDHIVTDLPFGKKIGSKERNMFLYPKALKEMARVCRPSGRAILLTHHKEAMKKALNKLRDHWRFMETRRINMGGLNVAVYMLVRTDKPYVKWTGDKKQDETVKTDPEMDKEKKIESVKQSAESTAVTTEE